MHTVRNILICVGIVVLLSTCVAARKKKRTKTKSKLVKINPDKTGKSNGKCVDVTNSTSGIKLRCGSKDVIYSININSYNSTVCDDSTSCSGLQPIVLTDSNLCYSKRSCVITFSNKAPIVKTSNATCIGRTPSKVKAAYRCVKKEIFYALYKRNGNKTSQSTKESDYGMLVSHDSYPWHYEQGLIIDLLLLPNTKNKTKLYISVPVMELDRMADLVSITDHSQSPNGTGRHVSQTDEGKAVLVSSRQPKTVIKFYTNNSSSTGKGFIICYYWTAETEDLSNEDICSKLKAKKRSRGPNNKKKRNGGKGKSKDRKNRRKKKRGKKQPKE